MRRHVIGVPDGVAHPWPPVLVLAPGMGCSSRLLPHLRVCRVHVAEGPGRAWLLSARGYDRCRSACAAFRPDSGRICASGTSRSTPSVCAHSGCCSMSSRCTIRRALDRLNRWPSASSWFVFQPAGSVAGPPADRDAHPGRSGEIVRAASRSPAKSKAPRTSNFSTGVRSSINCSS